MTASQSDKRQNASIQDMLGQAGQRVNLQGQSLSLAVGPQWQVEATHKSAAGLLGKSDESAH